MINIDRLITWLNQSTTQTTNNSLYQTIFYLIRAVKELQNETDAAISGIPVVPAGIEDLDFLTHSDESAILPNSRQLIAGTNVSFDDTIVNQRTVNVSSSSDGVWMPLTDGVTPETQLIFDGFGSCIMVFVPQ